MGEPMAANLCRAGLDLTVYNRSPRPYDALRALGAVVADTPAALFEACDTVILMLANDQATDLILDRGGASFAARVGGHLIVNMGTHSLAYSQALEADIRGAGGSFVEAPVSGSRLPAQSGALVAMLAGDPDAVARARPLFVPMCREMVETGAVPSAMAMKLAVNLYLVATVAALGEAAALAGSLGLDLGLFEQVITSGPLRSDIAAAKLAKMVRDDFGPQAAIRDVCKNAALVAEAAATARAPVPLLTESRRLFETVLAAGHGEQDMAAVVTAFHEAGKPT